MKRNYGIDLLRIYAMFTIILIHITGHGGMAGTTMGSLGINNFIVQFVSSIIAPAVNTFVLISGFVGYRSEKIFPNYKNIISLWAQVCFYSVLITLVFKILYPAQLSLGEVVLSAFPVITGCYWFFSVYFIVNILSPMLNYFVAKAEGKVVFYAISALLIFVSGFTAVSILFKDSFGMSEGFSVAWLATVYVLGAVIKKYELHKKIGFGKGIALVAVSVLCMYVIKLVFGTLDLSVLGVGTREIYYYCSGMPSPFNIFAAIGLVCVFSNINVGNIPSKIIKFITPNVFAVYLIHDNDHFRNFLMMRKFVDVAKMPFYMMLLYMLGAAVVIFVASILVDKIRELLFKLFRIEKLSGFIAEKIKKLFLKIYGKTERYLQ